VKLYGASDRLLGDNMAAIADSLLGAWPSGSRSAGPNGLTTTLAQGLLHRLGTSASPNPISKRIAALIERLNEAHYHARWEAGAQGPRILLGHCPYYAIIRQHPVLCQMDAFALGEQLGAKATQVAKIDPAASTVTQCIFLIK
jgi:predicted ArsR family transcriptional regulator